MFVIVGVIAGAIGVRGELKVAPESDHPDRLRSLPGMTVYICQQGWRKPYLVLQARQQQDYWRLRLDGIDTREAAQQLVDGKLQITREQVLPLPKGSYYLFEVMGLPVETADGRMLGQITEVLQPGANDVYVVSSPEGREFLIPAIKQVVRTIDLEQRRMVICPLPGLLDDEDEGYGY